MPHFTGLNVVDDPLAVLYHEHQVSSQRPVERCIWVRSPGQLETPPNDAIDLVFDTRYSVLIGGLCMESPQALSRRVTPPANHIQPRWLAWTPAQNWNYHWSIFVGLQHGRVNLGKPESAGDVGGRRFPSRSASFTAPGAVPSALGSPGCTICFTLS